MACIVRVHVCHVIAVALRSEDEQSHSGVRTEEKFVSHLVELREGDA